MRKLQVMPSAIEALKYWKQTDDKKYQKIKKILEQICAMPKTGIGKPEPLKHELTGLWSRRIDRANRLFIALMMNTPIYGKLVITILIYPNNHQ